MARQTGKHLPVESNHQLQYSRKSQLTYLEWDSNFRESYTLPVNRSVGMGDQLSLPATQSSHNLEGLVASPPNLQLMPTMAIGIDLRVGSGLIPLECTFDLGLMVGGGWEKCDKDSWKSEEQCLDVDKNQHV